MKQKLPLIVIGVVALLMVVGGAVIAYRKITRKALTQAPVTQPKKKRISDPLNVLAQADRPYIVIRPVVVPEGKGQGIEVAIVEVKKPATTAEYELEYQTDSNLEGADDTVKLDTLPVQKQYYLGTCSAGGACRDHTNVTGGSLLIKFSGDAENYALKQLWSYIENKTHQTTFTSRDGTDDTTPVTTHGFSLESKDLSSQKIVVIYNTPGYPKGLSGTPISEAYTLNASTALKGKGTVSIQVNDDSAASAVVMGYDGQAWKEFPATISNKVAKADVDLLPVYIVVKK